ncbi:hypothetical protein GDO81_008631 [Engystomops pustulosus]|uniref:Uncharacterized protein n=1 Tax=Engystomops pustulosus TaxID=76066 RepID=A0AAV7CIQ8_ENGPU|nr:hypothetical protein GDO81_008631 [Engystomops pustulosus]
MEQLLHRNIRRAGVLATRLCSAAQSMSNCSLSPWGSQSKQLTSMFWSVGGNRRTQRKPTQSRREHANSMQMLVWDYIRYMMGTS